MRRHRGKKGHENAFKGPLVDLDLHHPSCRGYACGQMAHLLCVVQFQLLPKAARRHGTRPLVRHVMRTVARLVLRSVRKLSLPFASCCLRHDWPLYAGLRLHIDSG